MYCDYCGNYYLFNVMDIVEICNNVFFVDLQVY